MLLLFFVSQLSGKAKVIIRQDKTRDNLPSSSSSCCCCHHPFLFESIGVAVNCAIGITAIETVAFVLSFLFSILDFVTDQDKKRKWLTDVSDLEFTFNSNDDEQWQITINANIPMT